MTVAVMPDHPDLGTAYKVIGDAFATGNYHFLGGLIDDLSGLAVHSDGLPNTARLSYALSIVQSVKPRDPLESLLAGQMAAIHIATMRMANILAASKSLPNVEVVERS